MMLRRLYSLITSSASPTAKGNGADHASELSTIFSKESFSRHDKLKKQVLLVGWYGADNYGDEIMLSTIYDILSQQDNIELSIILESNNSYDYKQWKGANLYKYPNEVGLIDEIAGFFDEVILGGGAHIDDRELIKINYVPYFIRSLSLKMIKNNKAVKWIGVSSSRKLGDEDYIGDLKTIIENSKVFSVRDSNSLDSLNRAGIDTANITIVDDIVFANSNFNNNIMAITLMKSAGQNTLKEVCEDAVSFIESDSRSWSICLLPFYNQNNADIKLFNKLIKTVDWRGVDVFIAPRYKNIASMILMMRSCSAFINMRYHASLIAVRMGKPVISVCDDGHSHYYNKMKYLHEKYGSSKETGIINLSNYNKGMIQTMLGNKVSGSDVSSEAVVYKDKVRCNESAKILKADLLK